MKRILSFLGLLVTVIAPEAASAGGNCSGTSVGLAPIDELTAPYLLTAAGGLYPGGANQRPPAHEAAGLAEAAHVVPLDPAGNPDPLSGRIVILTIGFSNTSNESDAFVSLSDADPLRHPAVRVVNGAHGAASAEIIVDPANKYWPWLLATLSGSGYSPLQVQAIWYKEAAASPTAPFPLHALTLRDQNVTIMGILRSHFPNARLCYVSSRIYAGYSVTTANPEPFAYESAFSYKWMIGDQIRGVPQLNFDLQRGPVTSPWIAWGPYLWADGMRPRADGLIWRCQDFVSDGTHPSPSGTAKVATRLLSFFQTDTTTRGWYLANPATGATVLPLEPDWVVLSPRPNPFRTRLVIPVQLNRSGTVAASVYSIAGQRVRTLPPAVLGPGLHELTWDGRDELGRGVAAGIYWIRIDDGGGSARTLQAALIR
jgi:hypothetical protein